MSRAHPRAFAVVACLIAIAGCGGGDEPELGELPAAAPCGDGERASIARGNGRLPMGFNDGAYLAGQDTPAESASMQRAAGSEIWRNVAQWQVMEPRPGRYDFSTTDPFYCAALAEGIAPLLHITTSPEWAADPALACPPHRCTSPPLAEHLDELRSFAAALTARYPSAIAIEAWNEPNLHLFWSDPDPERYVEVLRAIHDGVKAADESMPVLFGGLSDLAAEDPDQGDIPLAPFLDRALAAGAGDLVDAFNVHLYPLVEPGRRLPTPVRGVAETQAALESHGESGRPLWITELGVQAGGAITRKLQAQALVGLYGALAQTPEVEAVLFHTLIEPDAQIMGGAGYGWVSQRDSSGAFHPFPVYCAFARELAEPVDCGRPLNSPG